MRPELIPVSAGVFLLPSGWDASPSQGYPQQYVRRYSCIHLHGWREAPLEQSVLTNNTTQFLRPGLEPGPLECTNHEATSPLPHLPPGFLRGTRKNQQKNFK